MSNSSIVSALGAGSGIDIKALAESLVEASRAPVKERIEARVAQTEAKISGYGAMKYALADLKTAFEGLSDASDFNSLTVTNSQPAAFGVRTAAAAAAGTHSLAVTQLAQGQRSVGSFTSRSQDLNAQSPFWLNLTLAGEAASPIKVTTPTPAGIVSAINGAKAGVKAQLIDTGANGVAVVVTGPEGAANAFTLGAVSNGADNLPTATAVTGVDFSTRAEAAADARFTLNGLAVTRSTNQVSDVIEGVTLELYTTTAGSARVDLQRDTSGIKSRVQALVTAYNSLQDSLDVLADRDSEVETFGGALAGDTLLRGIRNQVRSIFTTQSSTPGEAVSYARHAGLSLDRAGRLTLDEAKLDTALADNFDQTMVMFSAGTSNKSVYGLDKAGLAGDAVRRIDRMLRSNGLIEGQIGTANKRLEEHSADLARLEERMEKLLARYTRQFAAMDDIVGRSSSTRSSLESSLGSMLSNYSNS